MPKLQLKQTVTSLFKQLPVVVWIVLCLLFIEIIVGIFFIVTPKQIHFSYANKTCIRQLVLAPSLMRQSNSSGYTVQLKNVAAIGKVQFFSTSMCVLPTKIPSVGDTAVKISLLGGQVISKQFSVQVPNAPVAHTEKVINSTVPVSRALKIPLSTTDKIFDYTVTSEERVAKCDPKEGSLLCDIPALNLQQGKNYTISLERHFNGKLVTTLAKGTITTLLPLKQTAVSVAEGQVIYDKPGQFTISYDKQPVSAEVVLKKQVGDAWEVVPTTMALKDTMVTVKPTGELARKTNYQLTVLHAEAADGSMIDGPAVIPFSTSGGPKVVGVSIGSYGVAQSGTITITLDQEAKNANVAEFATAQGVVVRATKSGNTVRIVYDNAPFCGAFTLSVKRGLESAAGVVNDEDWSFKSQTTCHTSRTIGTSTQGRAIIAHIFGTGAKTILYTGSIHGNEHSSRLLMNAWVNELEANPSKIPAGTRIIVVPSVNPDGTAANSRYNARNVDLNRNFNVSDWKKDIQDLKGQPFAGGGGETPESEAETKVLVSFTKEVAPYLTMSFHSSAAYAIGNTCGNSSALAARYAQLSGYRNMTGVVGAFSYEITGTYDDWLCEKLGRQSVLIELASSTSSEFARNKAALWEMARS